MSPWKLESRRAAQLERAIATAEAEERVRLDLIWRAFELGRAGRMERIWADGGQLYVLRAGDCRRRISSAALRGMVETAEQSLAVRKPIAREAGTETQAVVGQAHRRMG